MTIRQVQRRRSAPLLAIALIAGTIGGLGGGVRPARADTPPPPVFTFTLSASAVVPGPGDAGSPDEEGELFATDTPGELCPSVAIALDQATSFGL